MRIKDIIEAKKIPHEKVPNSILGKHKFNGNYDADKFKTKKKEEKNVREKVSKTIVEEIA